MKSVQVQSYILCSVPAPQTGSSSYEDQTSSEMRESSVSSADQPGEVESMKYFQYFVAGITNETYVTFLN